jgi:high-affinity Fe2+/Pb2+ permease
MRTVVAALLGLIGGAIAGVAISEIIGIVGYLVFDSAVGIKFLPIHLAILFAVVGLVVDARLRRRSEQPLCRLNQRSK